MDILLAVRSPKKGKLLAEVVGIKGRKEHLCPLWVPLKGLASLCSHCCHGTKAAVPVPVPVPVCVLGEGDCSVSRRLRRPHRECH